ncbi:MAG: hypothetical protein QNJ20_15655 [Paracoccaceae bacterium]|nr:hypothetical protein [Paracoccaceae bacterium]
MLLAACGSAEPRWASDDALRQHTYRPTTQPEIRLYTVISRRSGSGAHSGLLITTPQERILFDPAGTFEVPFAPERNDVHYAMSPRALEVYIDYHARETYDVVEQRLSITPSQANRIAALAKAYGPVPKAQCSLAINRILRQVAGFESLRVTHFPNATRERFQAIPGVRSRVISDDDTDWNGDVLVQAGRSRP